MLFSPEGDGSCANPCPCSHLVPTAAGGLGAEWRGQEWAVGAQHLVQCMLPPGLSCPARGMFLGSSYLRGDKNRTPKS